MYVFLYGRFKYSNNQDQLRNVHQKDVSQNLHESKTCHNIDTIFGIYCSILNKSISNVSLSSDL